VPVDHKGHPRSLLATAVATATALISAAEPFRSTPTGSGDGPAVTGVEEGPTANDDMQTPLTFRDHNMTSLDIFSFPPHL
jgi:hypothetical protein